ncbi:FtsX-like permease family protein [Tessaracoccus lubricantis]|uniref:FtsX-like permease family protein n=1 Tax=Tessaracoccus lubricantis TaxID=545543 RepID=UPI0031EBD5DD
MTLTLVVLMTLSVVLATGSAGLLARLAGASDRLVAAAGAPHVAQMHAGPMDPAHIDDWAAGRPEVVAAQTQELLGLDNARLAFDGVPQGNNVQQNSLVVPNGERDLLLGLDGQPLTTVEPGTIWLPVIYQVEDGLEPGDEVAITTDEGATTLTVAGFVRDAIMNTGIASSKRLAVSPADFAALSAVTGTPEYLISFWLDDPATQLASFKKAYLDAGLPSVGPMVDAATFNLFNMISEGLGAAVVILASVLLLAVGLLCLRLSFLAAIQTDQREIGVLTAIGVAPSGIRRMYLVKYGALGAVACVLGLLGGWALSPVLSRSVVSYLGDSTGVAPWLAPALVALALFGVIVAFILALLRRLGRTSAVEALRAGAVGRGRRSPLRLHRSSLPTGPTLGLMDLTSRPLMYVLLLAVLMTGMFTRMLLAGDASQIAIQRAVGAPEGSIRAQYLTRILVVLALGVPLGIWLALTAGQGLFNLMFEGMFGGMAYLFQGTSRIEFITNPWLTALALPAALFVGVGLAVFAATRTIRTASVSSLVTE